jgi:hypothetical protein
VQGLLGFGLTRWRWDVMIDVVEVQGSKGVQVILTGSEFEPQAAVTLSGGGMNVESITVDTSSQITLIVNRLGSAKAGCPGGDGHQP